MNLDALYQLIKLHLLLLLTASTNKPIFRYTLYIFILFFPRGKKRFKNGKVPQFMEGIEGIEIVTSKETIRYVQQAAQDMCNCHL